MPQRYRMPAGCDTELWSLVKPMRVEMRERGLSVAKLARDLGYDRSWVSRALSARQLPPRDLIMQIARHLDVDTAAAERRWRRNNARQQNVRARIAGGPPPGLRTYQDLRQALRELLQVRGISQRELTRRDPRLRRSTLGAVLRGERSAGQGMVIAVVRACGVSEQAEQAWADAWWRLGLPHRLEQRRRSAEGYKRKIRAARMSSEWT